MNNEKRKEIMDNLMDKYNVVNDDNNQSLAGLLDDACSIIEQAQAAAYRSVNETLIKRNWLLGMRIQHEVLKDKRAEYGEQVIANLANQLTQKYGSGFIKRNLHHFVDFFLKHSDFFYAVSGKSENILQAATAKLQDDSDYNIFHAVSGKYEIVNAVSSQLPTTENNIMNALRSQSPIRLSWTHYRIILQESNAEARAWYENEDMKRNNLYTINLN